jgi:hypothetical protein
MKFAAGQLGTEEARAMLDQLPELYVAVLRGTRIEQPSEAEVRCSFELPLLGKRTVTAPTALEAIRATLLEVADALTRTPVEALPQGWRVSTPLPPAGTDGISTVPNEKGARFQGKARQLTIGVTMPAPLKASVQRLADQQGASFAEVARQLAAIGFDDFDERVYTESSTELFSVLSAEVRKWQPGDTEQVMIRLDPKIAVRIRGTAKEHRRSASEFGAMCLAHGLSVLERQFLEIEKKIAAYRGPAVRRLAPQVGLGSHAQLLSGVLAGSIQAPRRVLTKLSEVLGESELALSEFFKSSFVGRLVPAFKSNHGKPEVAAAPTSWEDAVRSLKLPSDEAKALLGLNE